MRVAVVDPSSFSLAYDHHLCRGIAARGCDVSLFCGQRDFYAWHQEKPYSHERLFYASSRRFPTDSLPQVANKIIKGFDHLKSSVGLYHRLSSFEPDVIHFQWIPFPIVDRISSEVIDRRWPTVYTVHNSTPLHGDGNPLQRIGARSVRKTFDQLVCHTETTKRNLMQDSIPGRQITTIPHGALTYDDMPQNHETSNPAADNTILFFGSIREYKNPKTAIRAFGKIPETIRSRTVLRFVGHPKVDVEELQTLAAEEGVSDSVEWDLRYVPDLTIPSIFNSADLVLLPYSNIDQSGVLMTAMGFERPVVISDIGGFTETITDGDQGYLCPPEDEMCFADRITKILQNEILADEMSESMSKLTEGQYNWDRIAKETVAVYESII